MIASRISLVLVCLAFTACASGSDGGGGPGPAPDVVAPAADPTAARERTVHVRLTMTAADPRHAADAARDAVAHFDGWIESSDTSDGAAHLEIRVPASAAADARAALRSLGDVTDEHEDVADVTLAHADLGARIAAAHAEEARLTAMFEDRTAALADVLAVEHELARVRESIETAEAEERALSDRIALARITLDVARAAPVHDDGALALVSRAAVGGLDAARVLVVGTAAVVVALAPSAVLVALVVLGLRALAALVRRFRPA